VELYTPAMIGTGKTLYVFRGWQKRAEDGSVAAGNGCRRVDFYGGDVAAACPPTGVDHIDVPGAEAGQLRQDRGKSKEGAAWRRAERSAHGLAALDFNGNDQAQVLMPPARDGG